MARHCTCTKSNSRISHRHTHTCSVPFFAWSFLKARRSSTSCFHSFLITSPFPCASASLRILSSSLGHCSVMVATVCTNSSCWSELRVKSNFLYFFKLLMHACRSCLTPAWRSLTALETSVHTMPSNKYYTNTCTWWTVLEWSMRWWMFPGISLAWWDFIVTFSEHLQSVVKYFARVTYIIQLRFWLCLPVLWNMP